MEKERTLVLVKPDGVVRNLVGRILTRFEDAGLKIVGMKMVWVDEEFAGKHYSESLIPILGRKSRESYEKHGIEFDDTEEGRGKKVRESLLKYLTDGPVVAMVLEGVGAVDNVRKIVGATGPSDSQPGTIRGDFAHVSIAYANIKGKMIKNLIHASGNKEDAKVEVLLWFEGSELHTYKTVHDIVCFDE